ncbi:unnamed protein product [Brachionus calyciflorus]|uniref:Uncharacterized protein n=1 Tax=Brachionus calyciflorus TaxID=104777 RepID=A0A813S084_9BILA|nr:unnamed protein product [Brachionus calyciflorus]
MSKKKVSEAQRWLKIGLLREKTKSHIEIVDLVRVLRKCVFQTKFNYEMTYMTKELPSSERPESLTVEMSLIFFSKVRIKATIRYGHLASDFISKFPNVGVSK